MKRLIGPLTAIGFALATIAGASFAQTPGSGPNVGNFGNYGPPFSILNGHFVLNGAPPTLNAACGTGATVVGTDSAYFVTTGTGSSAACAVTPRTAWNQRPICNVDAQSGSQPSFNVAGNGVLTLTGAADSIVYNVQCIGQPGG